MVFNDPAGGLGLSFGFDFDAASVSAVEQGISRVATATDSLTASQQTLRTSFSQGQSTVQQATTNMQSYGQTLTQTAQQQQQFQQVQQQQISILNGAGTTVQKTAQQYTSYSDALGGMQKNLQVANRDIGEHNTLQQNLAGTTQTTFQKIQQLAGGFGQAAGAITGLVFSAHSLNRAQFILHRTETQLESARNKLDDMTAKLAKTTAKYGADSEQVAAVQADIAIQTEKYSNLQERAGLVQESYNMQLVSFATTTGPLVISTVSSLSQGITSMGEVLKISRGSVLEFIGAWGPLIGLGAGIAVFAAGVVNAMLSIQKANEDMANAIKKSDWDTALKAKLSGLKTETEDPFAIIVKSIESSFGGAEGGKSGIDLLKLKNDQKALVQRLIEFRSEIDTEMKSPEWIEAFKFPSTVTGSIDADLKVITDKITGMAINVTKGITLDPTYVAKFEKDLEGLITNLKNKVDSINKDFQQALDTGGAKDILSFILPDATTVQQNTTDFKNNLDVAHLMFVKFRAEQAAGYKGSVDEFISIYGQGLNDAQKEHLKNFVANSDKQQAAFNEETQALIKSNVDAVLSTKDRVEQESLLLKERLQMVEDAKKIAADLVGTQEESTTANELARDRALELAEAYAGLTLEYGKNDAAIAKLSGLQENRVKALADENTKLIDLADTQGLNVAALEQFMTVEGESTNDMIKKNTALQDVIASHVNYTKILDDSIQSENAISQARLDGALAVQSLVTKTELLRNQNATYTSGLNEVLTTQAGLTNTFGLTVDEMEKLVQAYIETGHATQGLVELQTALFNKIDITRAITNSTKSLYLYTQGLIQGRTAAQQFYETTRQTAAQNDAYAEGLMEIAHNLQITSETTLGDLIPSYIQLTTKELESLITSFEETGHVGEELANIMNERMAPAMEVLSGAIKAVTDEDFRNAFKDIDFGDLNKEAWKDFKNLAKDFHDVAEEGTQVHNVISLLRLGLNSGDLKNSTLRQGIDEISESLQKVIDLDPDAGPLQAFTDFLDGLGKKDRAAAIELLGADIDYLAEAISDGDLTPQEVIAFYEKLGVSVGASSEEIKAAVANLKESQEILNTGLGAIIDPNQGRKESSEESKTRFFKGSIVADELIEKNKTAVTEFTDMVKQIVKGGQEAQTALANFANQGSNSVSILVKNVKNHVTSLNTYFGKTIPVAMQDSQTAFANLAKQGGNSLAILVNSAKNHVTTLVTYFGTTVPNAIQKSVEAFVRLALAQSMVGGGGTGKTGFQNVQLFSGGSGGAALGAVGGAASDSLTRFLTSLGIKFPDPNGPIIQNPFRDFFKTGGGSGTRDPLAGILTSGGGSTLNKMFGSLQIGKDTKGGLGGGGAGDIPGQLAAIQKALQTTQTAFANLATQGSNSLSILAKNARTHVTTLNTYFGRTLTVAFQNAQEGIANFATQGANSLSILVKASKTHITTLNTYFNKTLAVAFQNAQEGIANFAKEGANSLSILVKGAKAHVTTLNTYFNKTLPVALQHSQEGFANLANEGSNSLSILAKTSSSQMSGMRKNLNVGYSAAGHLQTGLANLSNEGSKSLKALASASSKAMNGLANNMGTAEKAAKDLKSAIDKLENKTITVKTIFKTEGSPQSQGGVYSFAGGGLVSAAEGRLNTVHQPTLFIYGDNPGNTETLAFIPHNNPSPILKKLAKMFGQRGQQFGESVSGASRGDDSGERTEVINLYMDEQKMMTWIRKKLLRNRQGG